MKETATVTSDGLNLHKEPHGTASIRDILTKGDTIAVEAYAGKNNSWLYGKVVGGTSLGQRGWVDKRFVSIKPLVDILPPPLPLPEPQPKQSYFTSILAIAACFAVVAALVWLFG